MIALKKAVFTGKAVFMHWIVQFCRFFAENSFENVLCRYYIKF